ncbi:hypothetical protein [Bergeriella denitrificans]|uniref:Periplasmic protein n=1 Tax=Bergeriella denitrificans TaxID=494 RepID=A0A378UG54_BERDE|nr:hypothetical protein [Bergeriella denitrificans]STZ76287.1 Uncharacterised protein [Bergeriella denitrificans]
MKPVLLLCCLLAAVPEAAAPSAAPDKATLKPPKLSKLQAPAGYLKTERLMNRLAEDAERGQVLSEYRTHVKYVEEKVRERSSLLRGGKFTNLHIYREEYDDDGKLLMRERERAKEFFPPRPLDEAVKRAKYEKRLKLVKSGTGKALVYEHWVDGKLTSADVIRLWEGVPEKYLDNNDIKGFYLAYGFENYRLHQELYAAVDERQYSNGYLESRFWREATGDVRRDITRYYYPGSNQIRDNTYTEDASPAYSTAYHPNGVLSMEADYGRGKSCSSDHRWYNEQGQLIRHDYSKPAKQGCRNVHEDYEKGRRSVTVYGEDGRRVVEERTGG